MELNGWTRRRHVIEHVLECPEGAVADLQDERSERRMVIRPRKLIIHQQPHTHLVRHVTIEGRQVRRDGGLAGVKMILTGLTTDWPLAAPPQWVNEAIDELGLMWMTDNPNQPGDLEGLVEEVTGD